MNNQTRFLRLPEVLAITGLKRSTFYNLVAKGEINKGVKISERGRAWSSDSINSWVQSKLNEVA